MRLKNAVNRIFPPHARLPLATAAVLHFVFYCVPPLLASGRYHYDLSLGADALIPFAPVFVIFYAGAYLQWGVSYLYHCARSRAVCTRLAATDIIMKAVAALIFTLFPTTMAQPVPGDGVFELFVRIIYFFDEPVNLFPSLHCAASWLCFRSALALRHEVPRGYIAAQLVFSIFVFASTVLVKQHVIADVGGGVLLAEAVWMLCAHLPTERVFARVEGLFSRNHR